MRNPDLYFKGLTARQWHNAFLTAQENMMGLLRQQAEEIDALKDELRRVAVNPAPAFEHGKAVPLPYKPFFRGSDIIKEVPEHAKPVDTERIVTCPKCQNRVALKCYEMVERCPKCKTILSDAEVHAAAPVVEPCFKPMNLKEGLHTITIGGIPVEKEPEPTTHLVPMGINGYTLQCANCLTARTKYAWPAHTHCPSCKLPIVEV